MLKKSKICAACAQKTIKIKPRSNNCTIQKLNTGIQHVYAHACMCAHTHTHTEQYKQS